MDLLKTIEQRIDKAQMSLSDKEYKKFNDLLEQFAYFIYLNHFDSLVPSECEYLIARMTLNIIDFLTEGNDEKRLQKRETVKQVFDVLMRGIAKKKNTKVIPFPRR